MVRKGEQTVNLDIQGDVNVILEDGAQFVPNSINIAENATLTIWGQSAASLDEDSTAGQSAIVSLSGDGQYILNGGGVWALKMMASTDSGWQNECNVEVIINNGVVFGMVMAEGGFFHKNVTVNGGELAVQSAGSEEAPIVAAPIVADLIVNGGEALVYSATGTAIDGNLIANSGVVAIYGKIVGILYSDDPHADATVVAANEEIPTIGGTIGEEEKSWSGLLSVNGLNFAVFGEPSLTQELAKEMNLYIPAGTKLTTNGKLTMNASTEGKIYTVYVAGELDGTVNLEGSNRIRYALTGDTDVLTNNAAVLETYDSLSFALAGETINLPQKEHDGWLINDKFTQKQVASFQMPARATRVESHTHDFGDSSQCSCGMNEVGYTAPTAKTLTYNGTAQELVEGTVITGGTMYYKPVSYTHLTLPTKA